MRRARAICIAATIVVCVLPTPASARADRYTSLLNQLSRDGFTVASGAPLHLDLVDLYCSGATSSANYQNKGAPYVAFQIPGPTSGAFPIVVRLRPDEAIVFVGRTPPRARYFGFYAYLHNRAVPPPRTRLWNDLGDAVNIATIRSIGPDPFDAEVVLIYSADAGTADEVRRAVRAAGYPDAVINVVAIPSSLTKLGLDDTADELLFAQRLAMFADEAAGDAYVAKPPFQVLRVTPREPRALKPFPTAPLRVRGTGRTEMDLMPQVDALRAAIIARYEGWTATEYTTVPIIYEGFDFTQRRADSIGDARDALYLAAGQMPELMGSGAQPMTLSDDEFFIAYGVDHVATGKATYTNINVYATNAAQLGIASMFDDESAGGAVDYLANASPSLYAVKLARHCGPGEGHCLPLGAPQNCPRFVLDAQTPLSVVFRAYLEPETSVGPAYSEIVYDRVIKFSR